MADFNQFLKKQNSGVGPVRGGGAYKPVQAAPKPTWNPNGQWRAPVQQAPVYQAPAQPAQGNWDMVGGSANGGFGNNAAGESYAGNGGGGQAAATTRPPRKTSENFAAQYKNNDKGLALTDATFADQQSQYAKVLKEYIADYTRQGSELTKDTGVARAGIARNKEQGLTSQAEDFFARGVGNSGMFNQEQQRATDRYKEQDENVESSRVRQQGDLDFRKRKFDGENGPSGSNVQAARRDAYNRLALKQDLQ